MGQVTLKNFFIPLNYAHSEKGSTASVCAIVPTYKPHPRWTVRLVRDLIKYNKDLVVYVVDDCTPKEYEQETHVIRKIKSLSSRVKVLRTPQNRLKAGAINYCLMKLFARKKRPDIVVTLDDDVVIEKNTVPRLISALVADEKIGAVCSQCRALNKNQNLITRLQGLEYLGFNAVRLADQGFIQGPLVLHGMLSAYRMPVLQAVGLFAEDHLIEDYEMTARIKDAGWSVRLAPHSHAWTVVPDTFIDLWKQRIRWVVGGLAVISAHKTRVVFQDIVGHGLFLFTLTLILLYYLIRTEASTVPVALVYAIVGISAIHLLISFSFQLWFMKFYDEADYKDWLIRATLLPELVYANILSAIVVLSYIFQLFCYVAERSFMQSKRLVKPINRIFDVFARAGFTKSWGTR